MPSRAFRCGRARSTAIERNLKFFEDWPDNQRYWLKPDRRMYQPGDTIKLPTLARTLTRMVEAERAHKSEGRAAGIVAARDRFYKGDIAEEMVAFLKQHGRAVRARRFRRVLRQGRRAGA